MLLDMSRYSDADIELCRRYALHELNPDQDAAAIARVLNSDDLWLLAIQLSPKVEGDPEEIEFSWNDLRRRCSSIHWRMRSPIQALLSEPADPNVVEAEESLRDALLMQDADRVDALIADELVLSGINGVVTTKAEEVKAIRTHTLVYVRYEPRAFRVRQLRKDVALTTVDADIIVLLGTDNDERVGFFRLAHVWALEAGTWRLTASQVAELKA